VITRNNCSHLKASASDGRLLLSLARKRCPSRRSGENFLICYSVCFCKDIRSDGAPKATGPRATIAVRRLRSCIFMKKHPLSAERQNGCQKPAVSEDGFHRSCGHLKEVESMSDFAKHSEMCRSASCCTYVRVEWHVICAMTM